MEIALAPAIERQLVDAVARGQFSDAGEAVAEALRLLFGVLNDDEDGNEMRDPPVMSSADIEQSLRQSADDITNGRTVPAENVLAWMDSQIVDYHAARGG